MFICADKARAKSMLRSNPEGKENRKAIKSLKKKIRKNIKEGYSHASYNISHSDKFYEKTIKYFKDLGYDVEIYHTPYSDYIGVRW